MPGTPGRPTSDDNGRVDIRWAAAALGAGALVEAVIRNGGSAAPVPAFLILSCVVALGTTLPLALTRATPVLMALAVGSLAVLRTLTVAAAVAQLVAAYRTGRDGRPAVALVAVVPYLIIAGTAGGDDDVRVLGVVLAALIPAAALAGLARRMSREAVDSRAVEQAIAGTLLEHTARGERARIARELHDVVAHHISMVSVQAEHARLTTPGLPALGAERLTAIGGTARAALTEMRRLLGVLREDAEVDTADRQPQPGLDRLPELLDQARDAAGTGTRLIVRGPAATLDPGIELVAYRIVQEALTNSRRHAPGAAVDVELHYTAAALHVLIRDNGPGPRTSAPAAGHGLLGMRERAAAVGGRLRTGPAATGGFLVEVRLPTDVEAQLPTDPEGSS